MKKIKVVLPVKKSWQTLVLMFISLSLSACGDDLLQGVQDEKTVQQITDESVNPVADPVNPAPSIEGMTEFERSHLQDNGLDAQGSLLPVDQFFDLPDLHPTPFTEFSNILPGVNLQESGLFSQNQQGNNQLRNGGPAVGAALPGADEGFEPFSFVNYESPHVNPIDITPDKTRLVAVNTADNALMIFDITSGSPIYLDSVSVGLDPVSVRVLNDQEAWVVNHISDTVSIVNLDRLVVTRSLDVTNEPTDVVFAGTPLKAFVSASQLNLLKVFDLRSLDSPHKDVYIHGEDPRMLSVSPDGQTVYAAIFESGNGTTLVAGGKNSAGKITDAVLSTEGPYAGMAVPPNDGQLYSPAINPQLPAPSPVSMIVKRTADGRWLDDNEGDWSRLISGDLSEISNRVAGWDLPDNDIAVVDANSLNVSYHSRLMNIVMAMDVNPTTGRLMVVGTNATNEIRWEPNLQSTFVRVNVSYMDEGGTATVKDLNPHLNYNQRSVDESLRTQSIGDPRGVAWVGAKALISGMGSDNLVVVDDSGNREKTIKVGSGPTGIAVDASRSRAYVMNKFDASISVIDTGPLEEIDRVAFFDPTPAAIKEGRPLLYNTHLTSGLGQASCASCHVDARTDRLVWDLGDPTGEMTSRRGFSFHPMKGPMKTQTLQDIIGVPALHHIGDKETLFDFAGAFETLQGTDGPMDNANMAKLERMLDSVHYPPNPHRNVDNSLSTTVRIPGRFGNAWAYADAAAGHEQFLTGVGTSSDCASCHNNIRTRTDIQKGPGNGFIVGQPLINENLRGFYDRVGMWRTSANASTSGFGFLPDGAQSSELINTSRNFPLQSQSGLDVHAFLLSLEGPVAGLTGLARDSHAGTGQQVTLTGSNFPEKMARLNSLIGIADSGNVGMVAHGTISGESRSLYYVDQKMFQSDSANKRFNLDLMLSGLSNNDSMTFTLVPRGSEYRIGVDADEDGKLNRDELQSGEDPRNPQERWQECAVDQGSCVLDGVAAVRYGNIERNEFLYGVYTGEVQCNQFVFGNNKLDLDNKCYVGTVIELSDPTEIQSCESIDFSTTPILSYSSSQDEGTAEVYENGSVIRITNNGWKAIPMPFDLTSSTVLEFEFKSDMLAEEHSIGFDNDLNFSNNRRFKIAGSQNTANFAFNDFENYNVGSGYKKYRIPVGQYLQETVLYLKLIADHDANPGNGESIFRNVKIYDDPENTGCLDPSDPITPPTNQPAQCLRLDFNQSSLASYATQDFGSYSVLPDGSLRVFNNAWKVLTSDYEIRPETVIEFDFSSNKMGEEHSIGFDADLDFTRGNRFKLFGTQTSDAFADFNDYPGNGVLRHYKIPIGDFMSGAFKHIVFIADHDNGSRDAESVFKNVLLYDDIESNSCSI